MLERAALNTDRGVNSRLEKALAAAKRYRCDVVKENSRGEYRPAARWAGSREATAAADRKVLMETLEFEERSARRTDADRRRRLKLLDLEAPTGRR